MKLTPADEAKLALAHPDLAKVVRRCAEIYPGIFRVLETARSAAQQQANLKKGVSQTSRSRHVVANNKSRNACAADLGVMVGNTVNWKWPLYADLNTWMKKAAADVKVPVEWGGDWKTIKDGDHWQLPWAKYP
jgi:peptidoglycan L-alanyl-D-glutamate endopeptidase CwlK